MHDDDKKNKPKGIPKHRLTQIFKDLNMDYSENYDEFFKHKKQNISKNEWERLMRDFQDKMSKHDAMKSGKLVVLFENDYENLLEMRGFFRVSNMPNYVETIDKIIQTLVPKDVQ
jgi:hypothetical protein